MTEGGQYKVTVVLTRERGDDADVFGARKFEAGEAIEMVRRELQQAYDENTIGGSFVITGVTGLPSGGHRSDKNPRTLAATLERLNWHYGRGELSDILITSKDKATGRATGGSARVVCPKLNPEGERVKFRITRNGRTGAAFVHFRGHKRRVEEI